MEIVCAERECLVNRGVITRPCERRRRPGLAGGGCSRGHASTGASASWVCTTKLERGLACPRIM